MAIQHSCRDTEFFFVSTSKTLQTVYAMERRCKFDIIIAILDTVSCGTTKTKIVYATNLNFKLADKYLSFLQEHGLVEQHDGCYKITREGQEYLEKARELRIWVSCPVLSAIVMIDV